MGSLAKTGRRGWEEGWRRKGHVSCPVMLHTLYAKVVISRVIEYLVRRERLTGQSLQTSNRDVQNGSPT